MTSVSIEVNGLRIDAEPEDTVAMAMLRTGIGFGGGLSGCGVFCGMGSCYECHAEVDGEPQTRTCMVTVSEGMRVRTGGDEDPAR
jgi:predicted molibdopterin-dependent oxidoreductase YjgC